MRGLRLDIRQAGALLLPVVLFALGLALGGLLLPALPAAMALSRALPYGGEVKEDSPPVLADLPLYHGEDLLPVMAGEDDSWQYEESLLVLAPETTTPVGDDPPQVVVYCTHAGEEYAGQSRINGQAGGVTQVAASLEQAFIDLGVGVIRDTTLHDSPSYDQAYTSSLASITAIAREYPDIEVYIDVHRDSAIAGISTRLAADEGDLARMMLVVGSDQQLDHPRWQENYQFAQAVTAAANVICPGVMREPRVYSGRYNQHIAAKAILVEMGSTDNKMEEAQRSAAILAQAIVECM